jgi:hypothetical protein
MSHGGFHFLACLQYGGFEVRRQENLGGHSQNLKGIAVLGMANCQTYQNLGARGEWIT